MAAISHVFTIDYVAKMPGEDLEWLHELQTDMEPEDGCHWVHGVGEDGVPALTEDGIKYLKDHRTDSRKGFPADRITEIAPLLSSLDAHDSPTIPK